MSTKRKCKMSREQFSNLDCLAGLVDDPRQAEGGVGHSGALLNLLMRANWTHFAPSNYSAAARLDETESEMYRRKNEGRSLLHSHLLLEKRSPR